MEPISSRARRLGYVLKQYSDDPYTVERVAKALNYVPGELVKDMVAVIDYINELEARVQDGK